MKLVLPDRGVLIAVSDLQGNLADFQRAVDLWEREGPEALLVFLGDLVHGPELAPEEWFPELGEFYEDESPGVVRAFLALRARAGARVNALLGNHEHGHCGGPHTHKFFEDDVLHLEARLDDQERAAWRGACAAMPRVAAGACGAVLTHAAPSREAEWAYGASDEDARAFLRAHGGAFVAYGHDAVDTGWELRGAEQICFSSSFGAARAKKTVLRLDLGARYRDARDLRPGVEIRPLWR